jgi:hypothetical protein
LEITQLFQDIATFDNQTGAYTEIHQDSANAYLYSQSYTGLNISEVRTHQDSAHFQSYDSALGHNARFTAFGKGTLNSYASVADSMNSPKIVFGDANYKNSDITQVLTTTSNGDLTFTSGGGVTNDITWSVLSILNTPPGSPVTGDTYLVGTAGTGAWSGHNNQIATWNGSSWTFSTATTGDLLQNDNNNIVYKWTGTAWVQVGKAPWLIGLNAGVTNPKFGTSNNTGLGIYTNNTQRLGLSNAGAFTFNSLNGTGNQLMGLSSTGLASRVAIGSGLSLSGGTLSASGGSGSTVFDSLTIVNANKFGIFAANSESTNTTRAFEAVRYLIRQGGGTLYLNDTAGIYAMRVIIPAVSSDSICNIRILGATPPEQRAGTIGDNTSNPLPSKGVIIKSTATSGNGVIYVNASASVTVTLENLDIRTYDQPQISGVEILNGNRAVINNCFINTGIYNKSSAFPSTFTYGIRTPDLGNGASIYITNTTISGYYVGLSANEHTTGDNVNIYSCFRGLDIVAGFHAINFGRLGMYANNINVYCRGANAIRISELNIEHLDSLTETTSATAWQVTQADLKDTANLLTGNIKWWETHGTTGVHHEFTQVGGSSSKLQVTELGVAESGFLPRAAVIFTGTQLRQRDYLE